MSERLLDANVILEHVNDAVIVIDSEETITHWNNAAERIYGWDRDEAIGTSIAETIPVLHYLEDDSSYERAAATLLSQGWWQGNVVQPHREGHMLTIDSSVRLLHHRDCTMRGTIGVNRDITERSRKMAQAHFITSHALSGSQGQTLHTIVWQMTVDHDFVLISNSGEVLRNLKGNEAYEQGSRASVVYELHPEILGDLLATYLWQQRIERQAWWPHVSGEQRLMTFNFKPVPPDYVVCTIADTTHLTSQETPHNRI